MSWAMGLEVVGCGEEVGNGPDGDGGAERCTAVENVDGALGLCRNGDQQKGVAGAADASDGVSDRSDVIGDGADRVE